MKRIVKVVVLFISVVFVLATVFSVLQYISNKPPVNEIKTARETIASVKKELKGKYAVEQMGEAEKLFDQAMSEWQVQNNKFFVFRNYSRVRELAAKSTEKAEYALQEAGTIRRKLTQNIEQQLNEVSLKIDRFERFYKNLALSKSTLDLYNRGKIIFFEARHEYEADEIKKALRLIGKASENLSQAEKAANIKLYNFYKNYPDWEKNKKLAYSLSKKGQTVVLINKMESACILLKSGKEFRIFEAEFGINWMGDKMKRGDKATPEGVYKIIQKKKDAKTSYYKALLLDYPNSADKKRYSESVNLGGIENKSSIGGLIEIHGEGGRGVHWTDGCIALENNAMDFIYANCSVGTPVIIIGSGITLQEYLN